MPSLFTWFDKSPPLPLLRIDPGEWTLLSFTGNDRGSLDTGRSVLTRQFYAQDFTDANYPSDIRSRLVRFTADGEDVTDEAIHTLAIDWAASHTVEMHTDIDVPVGVEFRVLGPAPIFLTAWGFRGVSIAGEANKGLKAKLQGLVATMKAYVDAL